MNLLRHFVLVAATVLVVSCGQSEAAFGNIISSIGSAFENRVSSFVESFRDAILVGKEHNGYYEAKNYIQQQAAEAPNTEANKIILEGFLQVIEHLKSSADTCYEGVRQANNSMLTATPEVVITGLKTSFEGANMGIVNAGAKAYDVIGEIKVISGAGATQGLNEAAEIITKAGGTAFAGYTAGRDLGILGVGAGKDAPVQALLAASKAVQSAEMASYNGVKRAVKRIYKSLTEQPLPAIQIRQQNFAKDTAAQKSPKCQNAIQSVEQSAASTLAGVTSENKVKAIQLVRDAFVLALKTIALAGKSGYDAIDVARVIPVKGIAIETVKSGIEESKDICVSAVAIAQQALGGAKRIMNSQIDMPIFQAMVIIEKSRIALLDGLDNSLKIAILGIQNDAAQEALEASNHGVATAGYSAYAEIDSSAKYIMATIQSANL